LLVKRFFFLLNSAFAMAKAHCHNKRYKCVPLFSGEGLIPRDKRVLVFRLQPLWYLHRKHSRKRDLKIVLVILIFKSKCNIE
jgi:hypothetical protein